MAYFLGHPVYYHVLRVTQVLYDDIHMQLRCVGCNNKYDDDDDDDED